MPYGDAKNYKPAGPNNDPTTWWSNIKRITAWTPDFSQKTIK